VDMAANKLLLDHPDTEAVPEVALVVTEEVLVDMAASKLLLDHQDMEEVQVDMVVNKLLLDHQDMEEAQVAMGVNKLLPDLQDMEVVQVVDMVANKAQEAMAVNNKVRVDMAVNSLEVMEVLQVLQVLLAAVMVVVPKRNQLSLVDTKKNQYFVFVSNIDFVLHSFFAQEIVHRFK